MGQELQEIKERELKSRRIILHFIRHGEAAYEEDDHEGRLTANGEKQAQEAGRKLFDGLPQGAILSVYSSPRQRAIQTAELIEEEVTSLDQADHKGLIIHNFKPKVFEKVGLDDKVTDEALELINKGQDPVKEWLASPSDTTREIENSFLGILGKFAGLAHRIGANGPEVHIVVVSHTGPSEVFVGKLINRTNLESLANCEEFKIELPTNVDAKPTLTYKGENYEFDI